MKSNIVLIQLMNVSVQLFILQNNLVKPIITPRFALSCDMPLMKRLGELAQRYNVHIQVIYVIA
jgi:guanine deaminase